MNLFDAPEVKSAMGDDFVYSRAIKTPCYAPHNDLPNINTLLQFTKYSELIKNINNSNVTEEQKTFLRYAASRHIVFNYALIADYYANTTPEMQELMEQSALVILDIDDAVKNGYVRLTEKMRQLISEEKARRKAQEDGK